MSSTNKTANYELSQYIGSDKPTYLVDYNGDMLKIDTGMAANKAQADATDLVVSGHTSAIESLQGTTSDQGTAITGLRTDVDGNTGSINTINSLIGNGEPTTTDKTIIGAINELDADNTSLAGIVEALKTYKGRVAISVTGDGVKTIGQLMGELTTALQAAISALGNDELLKVELFHYLGTYTLHATDLFVYSNTDTVASMSFDGVYLDANAGFAARLDDINGSVYLRKYQFDTSAFSDIATDVVADGTNITYVCSKW